LVVPVTSTFWPASKVVTVSSWPRLYSARIGGAQLDQVATGGDAGLGKVPGQRLGHLARVDRPEGDLHARVAVQIRIAT
jgi:hypothetical protein